MNFKKHIFTYFCCYCLFFGSICLASEPFSKDLVDIECLLKGSVPSNIKFNMPGSSFKDWEIRTIREFAPCVKLAVRKQGNWKLSLLNDHKLKKGTEYLLAISMAVAAVEKQSPTPDIALFRPENQKKTDVNTTGNGEGKICVYNYNKLGGPKKLLCSLNFKPTSWAVFELPFKPDEPNIEISIEAVKEGVIFLADGAILEKNQTSKLYVPEHQSLVRIQGGENVLPYTIIKPGREFGMYYPNDIIEWQVKDFDPQFTLFDYIIFDPYGTILKRGKAAFGDTISYKPDTTGYYEIAVYSNSSVSPNKYFYNFQGASVLQPYTRRPGETAWGMVMNPAQTKHLGTSWQRGGLLHCTYDISQLDCSSPKIQENKKWIEENNVMPMEFTANLLHRSNAYHPSPPNSFSGCWDLPVDLESFSKGYEKLANLCGNYVQYFEFWNEPEGQIGRFDYWTIENFTNTAKAAYRGIKRANPNAKMGVGSSMELLKGIHENNGSDYYDFVLLHPYPWAVGGPWNSPEDGMLLELSRSARQWLDQNGGKDKQLWSTEYGYTTGTTLGGCSYLQQAQMNTRATLLQIAGGFDRVAPFKAGDYWPWGQVDGMFGHVRCDQTPKPSFVSYATLIRTIHNLKYQGRFDIEKNLAVFVFGDQHKTVLACWTTKPVKNISINLTKNAQKVSLFGKKIMIKKGRNQISVNDSVSYASIPIGYKEFIKNQDENFIPGYTAGIFDDNIQRKLYKIKILKNEPKLDGQLHEWQIDTISIKNKSEAIEAEIGAAIYNDSLYFTAKVRGRMNGENLHNKNMIWDGDCIEVFISRDGRNLPIGFYRKIDKHIGIAPGIDGINGKIANLLHSENWEIAGSKAVYKKHKDGYDIEASIPLEYLDINNYKKGDLWGFDIQLCASSIVTKENPDYRRRFMQPWSGTSQNYLNPYLWGNARLEN